MIELCRLFGYVAVCGFLAVLTSIVVVAPFAVVWFKFVNLAMKRRWF